MNIKRLAVLGVLLVNIVSCQLPLIPQQQQAITEQRHQAQLAIENQKRQADIKLASQYLKQGDLANGKLILKSLTHFPASNHNKNIRIALTYLYIANSNIKITSSQLHDWLYRIKLINQEEIASQNNRGEVNLSSNSTTIGTKN